MWSQKRKETVCELKGWQGRDPGQRHASCPVFFLGGETEDLPWTLDTIVY